MGGGGGGGGSVGIKIDFCCVYLLCLFDVFICGVMTWKCSVDVLNVVVLYVGPELLVSLFLGCGLDLCAKFRYDGFYYKVDTRGIRNVFDIFPFIMFVGLCVEYDYEYIVRGRLGGNCLYKLSTVVFDIDYLTGILGHVNKLKRLYLMNSRSENMYKQIFDSNVLMMFPNLRTLVLNRLCLRGLNGVLFCKNMQKIEVISCGWQVTNIVCFGDLAKLSCVKLEGCGVSGDEARMLTKCVSLRKLEIHDIWPITVPFVFGNLVCLKIKKYKNIMAMPFEKIKFSELSLCRKLRKLDLGEYGSIVDVGLISCPLRELRLDGCEVIGMNRLCELSCLRRLSVVGMRGDGDGLVGKMGGGGVGVRVRR